MLSSADCIITTSESEFLVHTVGVALKVFSVSSVERRFFVIQSFGAVSQDDSLGCEMVEDNDN
jgi:hypothetical protein